MRICLLIGNVFIHPTIHPFSHPLAACLVLTAFALHPLDTYTSVDRDAERDLS